MPLFDFCFDCPRRCLPHAALPRPSAGQLCNGARPGSPTSAETQQALAAGLATRAALTAAGKMPAGGAGGAGDSTSRAAVAAAARPASGERWAPGDYPHGTTWGSW